MDDFPLVDKPVRERQISQIDAMPLITALQTIRDAGRARKGTGVDDAAVRYARLANHTLLWFENDQKGDLELAKDHLDAAYELTHHV